MAEFRQRYVEYRRIGFNRLAALHFAWLVAATGARPIPVRVIGRH